MLTLGVAVVVVIVTRGTSARSFDFGSAAFGFFLLGLGIQIALEFVEFDADQIETVGYGLLMVSYAFILSFCFAKSEYPRIRRDRGWHRPQRARNWPEPGHADGRQSAMTLEEIESKKQVEQTVKHRPESDDDLLGFLGDTILLPEPFDTVVSFGDLIMAVGICELAYSGSRRRWRRGGKRDPMVQWRDSSTSRR